MVHRPFNPRISNPLHACMWSLGKAAYEWGAYPTAVQLSDPGRMPRYLHPRHRNVSRARPITPLLVFES